MNINREEEKLAKKVFYSVKKRRFAEVALWLILLGIVIWFNYPAANVGTKADILTGSSIHTDKNPVNGSIKDDLKLAIVTKVVDGDTFHYEENGQKNTVRMMGIDTPETVDPRKLVQCFGKEASMETKRLLEGKTVVLKKDSLESGLDKYGRQLLYVYLTDGTFVNEHLVAEGFAHATPQYKFDQKENFVDLENRARIAGKGLWNSTVCQ